MKSIIDSIYYLDLLKLLLIQNLKKNNIIHNSYIYNN